MDINRDDAIKGGGDFIIGQYMNESTRSFIEGREFVGRITEVNIWGKHFEDATLVTMSRDCSYSRGGFLKWDVFRDGYHGDIQLIDASDCLVPGKCL